MILDFKASEAKSNLEEQCIPFSAKVTLLAVKSSAEHAKWKLRFRYSYEYKADANL